MFNLFKRDPLKNLRKQYAQKLEEARDLQRQGNIKGFAQKSAEAETIMQQIEQLSKTT